MKTQWKWDPKKLACQTIPKIMPKIGNVTGKRTGRWKGKSYTGNMMCPNDE